MTEVELPENIKVIGNGAFAVTNNTTVVLSLLIPKNLQSFGENIFAGRSTVNLTVYFGSPIAEITVGLCYSGDKESTGTLHKQNRTTAAIPF